MSAFMVLATLAHPRLSRLYSEYRIAPSFRGTIFCNLTWDHEKFPHENLEWWVCHYMLYMCSMFICKASSGLSDSGTCALN